MAKKKKQAGESNSSYVVVSQAEKDKIMKRYYKAYSKQAEAEKAVNKIVKENGTMSDFNVEE